MEPAKPQWCPGPGMWGCLCVVNGAGVRSWGEAAGRGSGGTAVDRQAGRGAEGSASPNVRDSRSCWPRVAVEHKIAPGANTDNVRSHKRPGEVPDTIGSNPVGGVPRIPPQRLASPESVGSQSPTSGCQRRPMPPWTWLVHATDTRARYRAHTVAESRSRRRWSRLLLMWTMKPRRSFPAWLRMRGAHSVCRH